MQRKMWKGIYVYSLLGIFVFMVNALIHFQWGLTMWGDVCGCISVSILAGEATMALAYNTPKNRERIHYLSILGILLAIGWLVCISYMANMEEIRPLSLAGGILQTIVHAAVLKKSVEEEQETSKKIQRRVVDTLIAAFVMICCLITPVAIVFGIRSGYPLPDQVEAKRVSFVEAMIPHKERGSLELLEYDTPYYDEEGNETGKTLHKRAWVYLPYGYYDEENADMKYDVLYLSHGASYDENHFFNGGKGISKFQNLFDSMIENKEIKPMIVVTPCIYTGDDALDQGDCDLTTIYQYELRNHIVVEVEGKYRTYAASTSEKDLEASRWHRAFGGFSMGSMTTEKVFVYNLDYFANFIPMSVGFSEADMFLDAMENRFDGKYGADDFKMAMCTGGRDGAYHSMVDQYLDMMNYPQYFVKDNSLQKGNVCIYVGLNHRHGSEFVMEYLKTMLPKMFGTNQ